MTYKLKLNPDAEPVIKPPRRTLHGIIDKVKQSLDNMQADGIITKVAEPTEWVSSMVAAKKKNLEELCICTDPRDLNKAFMRPHHPLKTIEEVASSIPNATVFSILDSKCHSGIFLSIKRPVITPHSTRYSVVTDTYACPVASLPVVKYIIKP